MEVIYGSDIRIRSGIDTTLFLLLLVDIVVCDLYFDSHILFVLIITLILIIHVLIVLVWESIMHIPSPITSHFSSCCCESTLSLCTPHQQPSYLLLDRHFQLQLLLIHVTVIHWLITHMTPQAYIQLVVCLIYKELHHTALRTL